MMNVVKLSSSSKGFGGVDYNNRKVENGKAELIAMRNFPSNFNFNSSAVMVKDYLVAITKQSKGVFKSPQFHYAISAKGREHTKAELENAAHEFMKKMGYEKQPYVVVFHSDTKNNHVHIVSTRMNVENYMKIDDSFEKLKSQTVMREIMRETYGIDHDAKVDKLLSYNFSNRSQLEKVLESSGYDFYEDKNSQEFNVIHNGVTVTTIPLEKIKYSEERDEKRKKQIYAILNKYKDLHSTKVFAVVDNNKFDFQSELQHHLKKNFGLEIVFSHKDNKTPFGYTIIDHKDGSVFKGSDLVNMRKLFTFEAETIEKKVFDLLANFNINDREAKNALLHFMKNHNNVKDYMVFENKKRVPYNQYVDTKLKTIDAIRHPFAERNDKLQFFNYNQKDYVINLETDCILDLKKLVGDELFEKYQNGYYKSNPFVQQFEVETTNSFQQSNQEKSQGLLEALLRLDSAMAKAGNEQDEQQKPKRKKQRR